MTTKALVTPGTAETIMTIILFRLLMRLKRRNTRKARSVRSSLSGPSSSITKLTQPTATTMQSKMFQLEHQKSLSQLPYPLISSSSRKIALKLCSIARHVLLYFVPCGSSSFSSTLHTKLIIMRTATLTCTRVLEYHAFTSGWK